MATDVSGGSARRRLPFATRPFAIRSARAQRPADDRRHPAVALAMALPCAIALLLLFGGWEQMVTQTRAVADMIGR
ncbi:hypothetical protein P3T37_003071 [Kitasatospora sp. MAA4]|uniref:hypothetical protein n=1 Tax=Kitasatospora sp. MAA4 TaxID=3035093 RepID=UPI0024760DFC|nr:hypothetical protein [Kitasatospora sp. MAA4]MDH6133675.1 hypothetical protein [Kitasatospora sp. MAA4]